MPGAAGIPGQRAPRLGLGRQRVRPGLVRAGIEVNIQTIEATRDFKGVYHVLLGALSPLKGVGPQLAKTLKRLDLTRAVDLLPFPFPLPLPLPIIAKLCRAAGSECR